MAASKLAPAPAPDVAAAVQELDWPGEPCTVDAVMNAYNLECKTTGRWPGTSLFLVSSKNRSTGKVENALPGQSFKLFLVPRICDSVIFLILSLTLLR